MVKKQVKIIQPKYQQIAFELAKRITEGRYQEGQKLHARSTIATNFHVSPETARKAIIILSDLGVVDVRHGSGFFVASSEKAEKFVTQYQGVESITKIRKDINSLARQQQSEIKEMMGLLDDLLLQTERYQDDNQMLPFEIEVGGDFVATTITDLNFWHNTGATVVALKSGSELIISPGPLALIKPKDFVYVVGNEYAYQRTVKLLSAG